MEARRGGHNIFSVIRENYQPRILCPEKLSFKNDGKIKPFQISKIEFASNRLYLRKFCFRMKENGTRKEV